MRVAWLAPYPVQTLEPAVKVGRHLAAFHPCSWIVHMANALAQQPDVELHLVTESQLVDKRQVACIGNITFHVLKSGIPLVNRGYPPWFPLELWLGWRPNIARLCRETRQIQPHVVHAHGTEHPYALGAVASGFPHVISLQGLVSDFGKVTQGKWGQMTMRLEQKAIQKGRRFIAQSAFVHQFVAERNPAARVYDIDLAIAPGFFRVHRSPSPRECAMFVGTILPHKGFPELLEAFALFRRRHSGWSLVIIGDGNERFVNEQRKRAEELGVATAVEWRGFCRPSEVMTALGEAAMLVIPSRSETYGCALAEGMAAGLPVVACAVGGIRSLVETEQTGLLVERENPSALAEAMGRVAVDPELGFRLGQNARAAASARHDASRIADQLVGVYQETMGNIPKPQ